MLLKFYQMMHKLLYGTNKVYQQIKFLLKTEQFLLTLKDILSWLIH